MYCTSKQNNNNEMVAADRALKTKRLIMQRKHVQFRADNVYCAHCGLDPK